MGYKLQTLKLCTCSRMDGERIDVVACWCNATWDDLVHDVFMWRPCLELLKDAN